MSLDRGTSRSTYTSVNEISVAYDMRVKNSVFLTYFTTPEHIHTHESWNC